MKIGIDASRAFLNQRTGIEEYSYQTIKNLRSELGDNEVFLYVRKWNSKQIDFKIPKNWRIQEIPYVYGWTQVGLALEMLLRPVDLFFSPAHTTAIIHPSKTIVTVHGLEYEHCPENYSMYSRWFHRFFIKKSCAWATKIIAVSKKTKKDLIDLYNIKEEKIVVVYNGFESTKTDLTKKDTQNFPYLFYIGRIEQRKNVKGMIEAFEISRKEKGFEGKLILAGGPGRGYEKIKEMIERSEFKDDISTPGYVEDKERWNLFQNAEIFLFPSFCEGFGIPILEAQSMGTPVLTSNIGPLNEIAGNDEILVDPNDSKELAEKITKVLNNETFRESIVKKGFENIRKFSWQKSASEAAVVIKSIAAGNS